MRNALLAFLALGALVLGGCGASTSPLVQNVDRLIQPTEEGDFAALMAEAEEHWAQRDDKAHVERAIEAMERAVRVPTPAGQDRRVLLLPVYTQLSHAYYWLADFHLGGFTVALDASDGPEHEARLQAAHARGMEHGQTALALANDDWTRALQADRSIAEASSLLREQDMLAAYWYAVNASRWALLEGLPEILRRSDDIRALMQRMKQITPNLYYGAPQRYFGAYYTRLPFGSPDLARSERNFRSAIGAHPDYLDTRYLFAADWARATNSREVAEEQLQAILDFDLDSAPHLRAENEASREKARQMMESLDRWFR